jgi:predicted transcriptional regulator
MKTVSFRTNPDTLKELDDLAAAQQRDRTFVINEALQHYLSLQRYHRAQIEAGLADAQAGRLTSHEDVVALTRTWSKIPSAQR